LPLQKSSFLSPSKERETKRVRLINNLMARGDMSDEKC